MPVVEPAPVETFRPWPVVVSNQPGAVSVLFGWHFDRTIELLKMGLIAVLSDWNTTVLGVAPHETATARTRTRTPATAATTTESVELADTFT